MSLKAIHFLQRCRRFAIVGAALVFVTAARADEHPIDSAPRWWKGNLHTHTLWSDGDDFPEMVAERYRTEGYHFLALSDHNVLNQGEKWVPVPDIQKLGGATTIDKYIKRFGPDWIERRTDKTTGSEEIRLKPLNEFRALVEERERFIVIQSEEISAQFNTRPIHINATNVREAIEPQTGGNIVETLENNLRAVKEQATRVGQDMLPHINHPNAGWAITAEDLAQVASERFFEVYNGYPDANQLGNEHHPSLDHVWDIANTLRLSRLQLPALYGLATDDAHHYHTDGIDRIGPGRGWIMVRARHLTPESLIRAMHAGDFYASTGVTLNHLSYSPSDGTITIGIEAEPGASYVTEFIGTLKQYDETRKERNAIDRDGRPMRTTQIYSKDVGKVLAHVEGPNPRYKLTGDELYVRARITSSKTAARPSFKGQRMQAWTQPVAWQRRPAPDPTE